MAETNGVYFTLEVMETLLSALTVLLLWRVALCTVGAIGLSLLISSIFEAFTAGYCLVLVIAGAVFGVYWQGRADAGLTITETFEEQKTSRFVAFLGFSFVGLVCSAVFSALLGSGFLGGLALMAGCASVVLWYRQNPSRHIARGTLLFAISSSLFGYFVMLLLSVWAPK